MAAADSEAAGSPEYWANGRFHWKELVMIRFTFSKLFPLVAGTILMCGCASNSGASSNPEAATIKAVATVKPGGAATTQPVNNNVNGTVTFTQTGTQVTFVADIDGLEPNTTHGFHIHEKADLNDPKLAGAGGHFNPTHEMHGGPDMPHHHMGDLGNLTADANGHAHLEGSVPGVTLSIGDFGILQRSVIIHAKADDLHSQPAGESGARVAGGVIVISP
jgi:superoxide dismutase, Cu-Zn family